MDINILGLRALPAAALLTAFVALPTQASYVCTGASGPADNSTPYFDGDLTDTEGNCGITELEAFLSLTPGTIDESLILGSKIDSNEDSNGDLVSWGPPPPLETGLGTLTVTTFTNNTGTWSLTGGGITPLFFVDKYDGGYDIYTYMGLGTDPFGDSWNGNNHGTNPLSAQCKPPGTINCNANTSHISVYGVVPIPAAVWLFGSGLIGLAGVARRKRR